MNVEHPTSNNVFYQFKKRPSKANQPFEIRFGCLQQAQIPSTSRGSSSQAAVFRSRLQRDSLILRSIKRSVINIRCSMLDVRCSTFNLFIVPARRSFIRGVQTVGNCSGIWSELSGRLQQFDGHQCNVIFLRGVIAEVLKRLDDGILD